MISTKDDISGWVKPYTKDLFRYTIAKVPQRQIAEDLVQETFLSAYQSHDNFEGKSNVKTWLLSILKHKIADHYRSQYKKNVEVSSTIVEQFFNEDHRWKQEYRPIEWGDEKELLDDPEFANALKNCFEHLPEKWSLTMRLKFLEEHDADGICHQLDITRSNFWQIVHRAKLQLRNCLEVKRFRK